MPVLYGVKVNWASVTKPNTQFEPAWEIQVEMTKEQADEVQAIAKGIHKKGIRITKEESGIYTTRFRRKVKRADEKGDNSPPVVLGPDGEPFDKLIGNGSICNVQFGFSGYQNKFGTGVTSDLKGVRVLTHVPYGEQDGEGLLDDTNTSSTKASKNSDSSHQSNDEWDDDEDL